jgi:hypothetical protein
MDSVPLIDAIDEMIITRYAAFAQFLGFTND